VKSAAYSDGYGNYIVLGGPGEYSASKRLFHDAAE
jgi:hypothetical protein